jgi:hypothetical protein
MSRNKIFVLLLCLFYQADFPELLRFTVLLLREIAITKCVSRVVICKSESVERLSVEIVGMETAKYLHNIFNWYSTPIRQVR